ncbi:titin homolog isoform X2 [Ceratina calcarata]|uniref:Titin homolog isoform X1 n=1 Tax=Ceratina calcarata TaxID=156304 RepID=A0AAJ7S3K1_9HYME|nr:titin homolog isoform X1 [Ceratina calcarata]XP_026670815.1 titin homolog isoform X2 [Ceratina calcarata]
MEPEQRGRASRASSTSSLGREVRCGCQYYQSDSLLPERRALHGRPPSRTMHQPPAVRCSEHEYEPIGPPSPLPKPATAPVVQITDTDMVPVVDSDDSIDDRSRLPPELTRAGDVSIPLDGKIEDTMMEGRELGETGDTSEELESPQQLQDRLEERFLSAPTPGTESRTDGEVNTSQVDSLALEELPLRRGARGLPQRIKTQAGKLRTRLRNIQRPTFAFAERQKQEKARPASSGSRSDRSRTEKRPSRMDRIRSSFSDNRPRFSLPGRLSMPDRSKFHLPERPKFSFEKAKFHLPDKSKFNIKRPNIRLPNALTRAKKSPSHDQRSTESNVGSKRNIFDFSTYPRIFDKKSKSSGEYATSTPKDSRAESAESSTFPRARKRRQSWAERFEATSGFEDQSDGEAAVERSKPWRHPSMEEPRLSMTGGEQIRIPWEEKHRLQEEEEVQYMDYEQESPETSDRQQHPTSEASRTEEESYERESDPKLYRSGKVREEEMEEWKEDEEIPGGGFRPIPRSRSLEAVLRSRQEERYEGTFATVDPRRYGVHKTPSEEEEYEEEMEEDEERDPSSAQSDREQQQSSTSSCDRRRRGVIEEIDSDEFFVRAGLSHDDMNLDKYLTSEVRDGLRPEGNVLADEEMVPIPPQRPMRKRSRRKNQREVSIESYDVVPPVRPNRARRSESMDEQFRERTRSDSRHRVVYQTEGEPAELAVEPLDDIVVVKPARRKSRSLQRSQLQIPAEIQAESTPPVAPTRRKRLRKEPERRNGEIPICNGHTEWTGSAPEKPLPLPPATSINQLEDQEVYTAEEIIATSEENIQKLATRLREEEMVPPPVPPKRRSRSRGTSVAQDEDRTSHGAESLPEAGYVEEDIPRDDVDLERDLSGYAIIEKREKPPRPPPPRRKRDKFATAPRSVPPKRPQRAYSTLGPAKAKDISILTDTYDSTLIAAESLPYVDVDSDGEHKDLRSNEVLSKMQGRPLPAPPRPPRIRKDQSQERSTRETTQELVTETTTATQTDPLPDDMVIEEEVTQAKLVVAPSMSGSQIMVSTERIPSPSSMSTPPVPPLPMSQRLRKEEQPAYDTVSLKSPSPAREMEVFEDRHLSAPHLQERDEDSHLKAIRSALLSDEPVRISNLEVGDLRVDRLSVSQIDAGKIVASEVDALVITASELKSMGAGMEESLSPSIIRELMAIRSHLETVARVQEIQREESKLLEIEKKTDIPVAERQEEKKPSREDEKPAGEEKEEQKVVKSKVAEAKDIPTHTLTVVEDRETTRTLENTPVEPSDKDTSTCLISTVQTQDKSLQILDTERNPLSPGGGRKRSIEESRASLPPSPAVEPTEESKESRLSPDRVSESGSESVESKSSPPPEFAALEQKLIQTSPDIGERKVRKSRSRSSSPLGISQTPLTASPVRSLPPVISVTPDTPDSFASHGTSSDAQPQRAVISYTSYTEQSDRESQREFSQSPLPSSFPLNGTHLIAFPASQVPTQFYSLTSHPVEPSIADSTRQLIRVLRTAGLKTLRQFVGYVSSMVGEDSREKIREVELTLCALLLLVTGLLIFLFSSPRTITHHHHWDYFNPPK